MHGLRVLVVDDHPISRKVVALLLGSMDVEIVEAENGAAALESLATLSFDVVLLDMLMPKMDGPETIRRIRDSGEAWADIPVVAISAGALGDDERRYLRLGMNGYLAKPLTADSLAAELVRLAPLSPRLKDGYPDPPGRPAIPGAGR